MIGTEIKKIINPSNEILKLTTNWMYNWWGIEENYKYDEVEIYMKNSFNDNKLPQTYGLFLKNKLIGMYQLTYRDLFLRPDIYPWIANLYIDKNYRNKGYGKLLIQSIQENIKHNTKFKEIFLYTEHDNLYEKYNWEFIGYINTPRYKTEKVRLYKLNL